MSQTIYINQFKKSAVVGSLDMSTTPQNSIYTVRYNPDATSTLRLIEAEGVVLTDLGASDTNAAGDPLVDKRTNNYDALFGVKVWNIKDNSAEPGATFDIAVEGAVMYFQCNEAISRGDKVSLIISSTGQVKKTVAGYAGVGVALDKGSTNDIIRVKLTMDNTAVAAT